MKRRNAPEGFTLLEVILALIVFVGAAAGLSQLVLIGTENAEYARWQAEAQLVLETRLAEVDAGVISQDQAGVFPAMDYPGWQYSLRFDPAEQANLYLVTIEARQITAASARGLVFRLSRYYFDEATAASANASATSSDSDSGAPSP